MKLHIESHGPVTIECDGNIKIKSRCDLSEVPAKDMVDELQRRGVTVNWGTNAGDGFSELGYISLNSFELYHLIRREEKRAKHDENSD